jgi:hypothetical protein
MSGLDQLLVVLAGFGAGLLTSTVGVASLLSFPILLAVGLPPVVANASNTIGLVPRGRAARWGSVGNCGCTPAPPAGSSCWRASPAAWVRHSCWPCLPACSRRWFPG